MWVIGMDFGVKAVPYINESVDEGWDFACQREEIAPLHFLDSNNLYNNEATLVLQGGGKDYANGMWTKTVPVEAGAHYEFRTFFLTKDVNETRIAVFWLALCGRMELDIWWSGRSIRRY